MFENHDEEYTETERARIVEEGYLALDRKTRVSWCRIGYSVRGYMYFVDACPSEVLDVCRSLWLTGGVSYLSVRVNYLSRNPAWKWIDPNTAMREDCRGGYSA